MRYMQCFPNEYKRSWTGFWGCTKPRVTPCFTGFTRGYLYLYPCRGTKTPYKHPLSGQILMVDFIQSHMLIVEYGNLAP